MGTGKSTFTNTLTGSQEPTSDGCEGCTKEIAKRTGNNFTVTDTPGDGDPKIIKAEWKKLLTDTVADNKFDVVVMMFKANKSRVDARDCS